MKTKKIFLTLSVVFVLLIAMAMFVSATEFSADFGEMTTFDGMSDKNLLETTSRVVLANGDGTYTTYPSYYIMRNNATLSKIGDSGFDFAELNEKTGKSYSDASIILIEIPSGITEIKENVFGNWNADGSQTAKSIEKIILPDSVTKLTNRTFRGNSTLKSIALSTKIENIDAHTFSNCKVLEEVIIPEESELIQINANAFESDSKLAKITFENAKKLKTLNGDSIFRTCSMKIVDLSETQLESINGINIFGASSIETIIFPATLHKISKISGTFDVFGNNDSRNLKTIVFLGEMTELTFCAIPNLNVTFYFAQNSSEDLNGKFIETSFVEDNLLCSFDPNDCIEKASGTLTIAHRTMQAENLSNNQQYNGNLYKIDSRLFKFIFIKDNKVMQSVRTSNITGSDANFYAEFDLSVLEGKTWTVANGTDTYSQHVKLDSYCNLTPATCMENEIHEYYCLICNKTLETTVVEDTALGHDWKVTQTIDVTCTAAKTVNYVCNRCNETKSETEGSALGHDFAGGSVTAIIYEDFTLNGTKTTKCSRCDVTEDSSLAPIFTVLGYSKSETDGVIGLKAGYAVDFDALNAYEDFNNVKVEYGMKLANAKYASEISNDASENVFSVDLTESDYNRFNTTIVGFKDTDAHKNLSIIMLAYAKCGDKVQYIQAETSSGEVDGFKTITIATVEAAVEAQPAAVVAKED